MSNGVLVPEPELAKLQRKLATMDSCASQFESYTQIDDKTRISQLTYALGLAIGALETICWTEEFSVEGLASVMSRLKAIAEPPFYIVADEALKGEGAAE